MSKIASSELFELIKSLSKTEKKYFKQYATRHTSLEKNNSVMLFDMIDKQKEYNELLLLKKEKGIDKKQLADLKLILYKTILKSLSNFHAANFIDIDLRNRINGCLVLFEKGLYDQCEKQLLKTKEKILLYEKETLLMDVLNLEKELIKARSYANTPIDKIESIYINEYNNALLVSDNNNKIGYLATRFFKQSKSKGNARSKEEVILYREIVNHPVLKQHSSYSLIAKTLLYNTKSTLLFRENKNNEAIQNATELINIIEHNPQFIKAYPRNYIAAINNVLVGFSRNEEFEKIPFFLNKLKSLSVKSYRLQNEVYFLVLNRELSYLMNTHQFNKCLKLIKDFEKRDENKFKILNKEYETNLQYNFGCVLLIVGEYKQSRFYFQQLTNKHESNILNDLLSFSRILLLICDYESGNNYLIEYSIKSTYKFLLKRKKMFKFEEILLKFIRKIALEQTNKNKLINEFKLLKQELLILQKNKFEKQAFEYFDFIAWLDSKIQNKPLLEILLKKTTLK